MGGAKFNDGEVGGRTKTGVCIVYCVPNNLKQLSKKDLGGGGGL